MLILTFNDSEEKALRHWLTKSSLKSCGLFPPPMLSFSGLEIRQHQRRVLRNGIDISLTRLEYGALVFLIRRCLGLVQSLIMIRLSLSCALPVLVLLKCNDTS